MSEKQPEAWRGPNGEMRNRPPTLTPLQLFKRQYCERCNWYEVCNPEQRLACILSKICDSLELFRRTTQERTAHLTW
jgi:hypothetical protein